MPGQPTIASDSGVNGFHKMSDLIQASFHGLPTGSEFQVQSLLFPHTRGRNGCAFHGS